MKLLFDQNISHRLIPKIKDILPRSIQIRQLGLENFSDKQIWEYAKRHEFTIVSFDVDFYNFFLVWGHPHKIIWIRTTNQTTNNLDIILRKRFASFQEFQEDTELACLEIIDVS